MHRGRIRCGPGRRSSAPAGVRGCW